MNIFQKAYHKDLNKAYKSFSAGGGEIILDNVIGDIPDLQDYFEKLAKQISSKTKVLISYHNHIWEPALNLASILGLRKKVGVQNWITQDDLTNILHLGGFEVITSYKRFWGITAITITRPRIYDLRFKNKDYSVSIIVPARNEEGNIAKIVSTMPKFGSWQEVIFVEGNSTDQTWAAITNLKFLISNQIPNTKFQIPNTKFKRTVRAYKQIGKGKADAVKIGFEKAKGDIVMIYDADRTVPAADLRKFYNALVMGLGEFINGSRLVYPMESQAMKTLNKLGNHFFSCFFTWIFGQHFKDTLCGTKAVFRKDFLKIKRDYLKYLKVDPFGDFALIFASIKHNLKVVEIPIRYKEREYGVTNISRFRHGLLLLKMTWIGLKEFKF